MSNILHHILASIGAGACALACQAADGQASGNAASRLESIKADLLDITPGAYISPLLTASYALGTTDVGPLSFDFDGYFVRGGAAIGYQERNLRLDIEPSIGFAKIEVDDAIEQIGGKSKSDIWFSTLTANVYYDFQLEMADLISDSLPEVRPYLGAGVGGIYLDVEDTGDDLALVSQIMAGLGVRVSPNSTFDLGYRLIYLPRIEVDVADFETLLHAVELKLRYRF